jgi:hypothetical protein
MQPLLCLYKSEDAPGLFRAQCAICKGSELHSVELAYEVHPVQYPLQVGVCKVGRCLGKD